MLTGNEQYTDPVSQLMIGVHAYYQKVSYLAFKAIKLCISQIQSVGYFHNLVQQAVEPFLKFLSCVIKAVENCVPSGPTKNILIKQQTREGLNTIICNAIAPVRNEGICRWVLAAHDIDT